LLRMAQLQVFKNGNIRRDPAHKLAAGHLKVAIVN
jgi:hypothetical protein